MRFHAQRNRQHFIGGRHFEIKRLGNLGFEPFHIGIANMATIFAQMRGDAVRAGFDRDKRRTHGIGQRTTACIAHGGDVIDVDAETRR